MRILAVGPHPDDVEFGCAPVLIQEARRGHEVHIVVTSQGEAASAGTPEERAEEAREAARIIGATIEFLDFGYQGGADCQVEPSPTNAAAVARVLREFRPQIVLAPLSQGRAGENQHPDHRVVGQLVRDAARLARYGGFVNLRGLTSHQITSLYYYAITQVFVEPPQLMVDVSSAFDEWQQAMACHASQMKTRAYPELVNARARAWGQAIGVEYAVGLWLNDPVRVESLCDLTLSSRYF